MRKTLSAEQKDQIFRLRKVREDLGLSQEEFANILEISISTYKKMESYERRISLASLMKLHSELNVSADYILFGEKTEQQKAWTDVLNCPDTDKMIIFLRLFQYFTLNKTDFFLPKTIRQMEWKMWFVSSKRGGIAEKEPDTEEIPIRIWGIIALLKTSISIDGQTAAQLRYGMKQK